MDTELLIQQIFAAGAIGRVCPRAIRTPARERFPNFCSHPQDQTGVVTHPRREPPAVVKVQTECTTVSEIVHRLSHCFAAIFQRDFRCRASRANNNVCTRLIRQLLDYWSKLFVWTHLRENLPARHVGLFHLKPGSRPWNEAFDGS